MSSFDLHDQIYPSASDPDSSDSEGEAYAPCKSTTTTLRPIVNLTSNEGPSITLTTPSTHGNPSLPQQTLLHRQKVAEPGRLNPGAWGPGIAKRRQEARARDKERRSRSVGLPADCVHPIAHWIERRATNGSTYYLNCSSGETTWEKPEGYLSPDERFELGIGIEPRPRAKSAGPGKRRRRSAGLWDSAMQESDLLRDNLSARLEGLSLNAMEDDPNCTAAGIGRDSTLEDEGAGGTSRGHSRMAKTRYYARLQAEGVTDRKGLEEVREKAKLPMKRYPPADTLEQKGAEQYSASMIQGNDAVGPKESQL